MLFVVCSWQSRLHSVFSLGHGRIRMCPELAVARKLKWWPSETLYKNHIFKSSSTNLLRIAMISKYPKSIIFPRGFYWLERYTRAQRDGTAEMFAENRIKSPCNVKTCRKAGSPLFPPKRTWKRGEGRMKREGRVRRTCRLWAKRWREGGFRGDSGLLVKFYLNTI